MVFNKRYKGVKATLFPLSELFANVKHNKTKTKIKDITTTVVDFFLFRKKLSSESMILFRIGNRLFFTLLSQTVEG